MDIIIPYRNRPEHLQQFLDVTAPRILKSNNDSRIIIVEQSDDDRLFNRGALLNVGVLSSMRSESPNTQVCLHDVDLQPSNSMVNSVYNVSPENKFIIHPAAAWKNCRYPGKQYLGGVTIMPRALFCEANGFPNNFWGWGGEDDEFARRLLNFRVPIFKVGETKDFYMTDLEDMTFDEKMDHLRKTRTKNYQKWELKKECEENDGSMVNGLSDVLYRVIHKKWDGRVEHLLVDITDNSEMD